MLQVEEKMINGKVFIHTFSDLEGYGVERDGVVFQDAYDPIETQKDRVYTEKKIEEEQEDEDS